MTQSDIGLEAAINSTHENPSKSESTIPRSQSTDFADDVPYFCTCLSQTDKAPKCPNVPARFRGKIIEYKESNLKRMSKRHVR